jgi:hypothetical protein
MSEYWICTRVTLVGHVLAKLSLKTFLLMKGIPMKHCAKIIPVVASLVLLASCGRSPTPVGSDIADTPLLAVAELGGSISNQALASGFSITFEDEQIDDQDGLRTHVSQYFISGIEADALSLYPVATAATLAGTNVTGLRNLAGDTISDVSVAQSIALEASDVTTEGVSTVQALLEDAQALGTVISTEAVSGGFRVVLEKRYPFDSEDPNAIDSFLMLFAFVAEDAATEPTADTLTFSMASVNIVPGETDIEVVIAPNLPAPTITLAN